MTTKDNDGISEWQACALWMSKFNVFPEWISKKLLSLDLELDEFVSLIRDGELLCDLANAISENVINPKHINRRTYNSQMLSLSNIRLFLNACETLGLTKSDLFGELMLYDLLDLARVARTLSLVSKTPASQRHDLAGFRVAADAFQTQPMSENLRDKHNNNEDQTNTEYLKTQMSMMKTSHECDDYLNIGSMILNPKNELYDRIVTNRDNAQSIFPGNERHFVMREIVQTEKNFINSMSVLISDFQTPLCTVLNSQDQKIVFMNIQEIQRLHKKIYEELENICKQEASRTKAVCKLYEKFKPQMMQTYMSYFTQLEDAIARSNLLTQLKCNDSNHSYLQAYRQKLEECKRVQEHDYGNFNLSDLLRLPYQRVLKYHLLFNQLSKNMNKNHASRMIIEETAKSMNELGHYLNTCYSDKENMKKINRFFSNLKVVDEIGEGAVGSFVADLNDLFSQKFGHYLKDANCRIKQIDSEVFSRSRSCFLFEKALVVCNMKGNFYGYKYTLHLSEFYIEESNASASALAETPATNTFFLVNTDKANGHVYQLTFTNNMEKSAWKKEIEMAKERVNPQDQTGKHGHFYELANFEQNIVQCFQCSNHLNGIFYQGFRCVYFQEIAHRDCLSKVKTVCTLNKASSSCSSHFLKPIPSKILSLHPSTTVILRFEVDIDF